MNPGTHRFVVLDALRGLCALLVCLFHFEVNAAFAHTRFIRESWQFVDFFFVLSGFVIAANYQDRLRAGLSGWAFLGLRLGRIYPLHVVMLAVFVAAEIAGALAASYGAVVRPLWNAEHDPLAIPAHLLLIHSFGLFPTWTWNAPAWSIGTEFWAYVLFLGIVAATGRRAAAAFAAVAVVCPVVLWFVSPNGINVSYDWGMVRCAYGFALGALAWDAWRRWGAFALARERGWTIAEVAALAAICAFVAYAGQTRWTLCGPPLFAVVLTVFARGGGGVSGLLSTPLPLWVGTLSYSIYMTHAFVLARFDNALKAVGHRLGIALTTPAIRSDGVPIDLVGATSAQGGWLTLAMLLLVVGVSWVTWRLIELPGQRWSRARFDPRVRHASETASVTGDPR